MSDLKREDLYKDSEKKYHNTSTKCINMSKGINSTRAGADISILITYSHYVKVPLNIIFKI